MGRKYCIFSSYICVIYFTFKSKNMSQRDILFQLRGRNHLRRILQLPVLTAFDSLKIFFPRANDSLAGTGKMYTHTHTQFLPDMHVSKLPTAGKTSLQVVEAPKWLVFSSWNFQLFGLPAANVHSCPLPHQQECLGSHGKSRYYMPSAVTAFS